MLYGTDTYKSRLRMDCTGIQNYVRAYKFRKIPVTIQNLPKFA